MKVGNLKKGDLVRFVHNPGQVRLGVITKLEEAETEGTLWPSARFIATVFLFKPAHSLTVHADWLEKAEVRGG